MRDARETWPATAAAAAAAGAGVRSRDVPPPPPCGRRSPGAMAFMVSIILIADWRGARPVSAGGADMLSQACPYRFAAAKQRGNF